MAVAAFGAFLVLGSIDDDPGATRVSVMDLPAVTPTATATVTAVATATPRPHAALLDGVHMSDAEWELRRNRRPLAIVIDNVAGGVPQAGLDQADLVYESIVEGGSTRFLAVFWRRDAEAVFPVRSARTPFVILASELDALLGHGGSAQTDNEANASGQILEWNGSDLDAFQPPAVAAYRRLGDRFAPYNLAVSTLLLRQVASEAGFERPATASPWEFADDRTRSSVGISAGGVEVSFRNQRTAGELIQFRWDPLANDYIRYQWGGVHPILPELKPLRFKNVVVMRVPLQVVDDSGHVVLEQIGNGAAQIFLDGVVIEATWRKPNRTARTRFYDQAGEEIPFNRGPIMIEVVSPTSPATFSTTASGLPPLPGYAPPTFALPEVNPGPLPSPSPTAEPTPTPLRLPTLTPTATRVPATPTPSPAPALTPTPTREPPSLPE